MLDLTIENILVVLTAIWQGFISVIDICRDFSLLKWVIIDTCRSVTMSLKTLLHFHNVWGTENPREVGP